MFKEAEKLIKSFQKLHKVFLKETYGDCAKDNNCEPWLILLAI